MSLSPPLKVRTLQAALHAKAKGSPTYRFYALYDKLYRWDVLAYAYACCKANGGAAGVDGEAFPDIEAYGEERWLDELAEERVARLNRVLRGWANYFCLGPVSKAYRAVDAHARNRLRQWLCRKHKKRGRGTSRYPDEYLYETLGLVRLPALTRRFPWAKA